MGRAGHGEPAADYSPFIQKIVIGAVIVLAVTFDEFTAENRSVGITRDTLAGVRVAVYPVVCSLR